MFCGGHAVYVSLKLTLTIFTQTWGNFFHSTGMKPTGGIGRTTERVLCRTVAPDNFSFILGP